MNPERYLELYKKYIKGEENVFGIRLIPVDITDDYEITYRMSNPKRISYSKPSIRGWITERRREFNNVLGLNIDEMMYLDCKELYISEGLIEELTDCFNGVREVKVGPWEIRVRHGYFTAGIRKEDSFVVTNYVEPIRASLTTANAGRKETDLNTAIEHYKNFQRQSRYDETDRSYPEFDGIINENPALVDGEWMTQYVITEFITPD
jgi:hypothetical protein